MEKRKQTEWERARWIDIAVNTGIRKNHEQDHVRNILRTCGNMQAYVNVDIVNPLKEVLKVKYKYLCT